jgi:hypothetical protein
MKTEFAATNDELLSSVTTQRTQTATVSSPAASIFPSGEYAMVGTRFSEPTRHRARRRVRDAYSGSVNRSAAEFPPLTEDRDSMLGLNGDIPFSGEIRS